MDLKKYFWQVRELWQQRGDVKLRLWFEYAALHIAKQWRHLNRRARPIGPPRLLFLVSQFPPVVNGGVFRPLHFVKHLAQAGWDVTVLTGPLPQQELELGRLLREKVPEAVKIANLPDFNTPEFKTPGYPSVNGGFFNAISTARWAIDQLAKTPPDVVVASGPQFFNFISAVWVQRAFGCKMILDYRDEWTECTGSFVPCGRDDRAWERRAQLAADKIVVTTNSMLEHMHTAFPVLPRGKCINIPNGWDPEDFESVESHIGSRNGDIVIGYFGSFGADYSITPLLEVLSKGRETYRALIERLRFECYALRHGAVLQEIETAGFSPLFTFHDPLPKRQMFERMQSMDMLLLLNPAAFFRYVQGKIYEYVASATPIIVLGTGGEVGETVLKLECGHVVAEGNATDFFSAVEACLDPREPLSARVSNWLAENTRSQTSRRFTAMTDELIGRDGNSG